MKPFLPVSAPTIGQEEIDEVIDSLRSGWITTGPKTQRFERELRDRLQAEEVVALSSCTAALHLSLVSLGIGPGDEVIASPLTFVSSVNGIVHSGATPVLADVDPETLNLSPESVARRISPRTRAVQVVHLGGQPCDLDEISRIAAENGAVVIEDAAHALGSRYRDRPIGSISPFTCFSFYATKNATTAEGGCLALNDLQYLDTVRHAALHGMSRDAWKRHSAEGSWRYDIVMPGYKYNLTDLQAAIGLHQLRKLDDFNRRRGELVERYRELLAGHPVVRTFDPQPDRRSADHLMIVRVDRQRSTRSRDALMSALKEEQVGTTVNFIPIYEFTAYRDRFDADELPGCRSVADELLTVPLFPGMTDEDVDRVVEALDRLTT